MRLFALLFCIALPTVTLAEQSIRQFQTTVPAPATTIIQQLERTMPETVLVVANDQGATLSYTGLSTPRPLISFLTATFPDLATSALGPNQPVIIGVDISANSLITAMINASFPADASSLQLPPNAQVLMQTDGAGECTSQQVIAHPSDIATAAEAYKTVLTNQGFTLDQSAPEEVSYFIGRSDSCSAILYLRPDPDDETATLVVLRLLED